MGSPAVYIFHDVNFKWTQYVNIISVPIKWSDNTTCKEGEPEEVKRIGLTKVTCTVTSFKFI